MAPGKLITRLIQSSNEPAAESEVINRVSCVWSFHRKDEWSATAAVTSLNITHWNTRMHTRAKWAEGWNMSGMCFQRRSTFTQIHTDTHTTSCTWKHNLVAKHRFHLAHSADHMLTHSYSSCVKVFSHSVHPMCTDLQGFSTRRHTSACALTHTHPVLLNRSGCFTSCDLHIKDMSVCIITGVECVC